MAACLVSSSKNGSSKEGEKGEGSLYSGFPVRNCFHSLLFVRLGVSLLLPLWSRTSFLFLFSCVFIYLFVCLL